MHLLSYSNTKGINGQSEAIISLPLSDWYAQVDERTAAYTPSLRIKLQNIRDLIKTMKRFNESRRRIAVVGKLSIL